MVVRLHVIQDPGDNAATNLPSELSQRIVIEVHVVAENPKDCIPMLLDAGSIIGPVKWDPAVHAHC